MSDTITDRADGLQQAMAPIVNLEGGMSGAATLTAQSPFATIADFADELGDKMSAAVPFNADQLLAPVSALGQMKGHLQAPPTGALDGFGIKMEQTEGGLANDFPTAVAQTVGKLDEILDRVPSDPSALASLLLDQIVAVFGTLDGPEAAQIKAWIASVEGLVRDLQPVIDAAQSSNDPATIAVQIIERAIRAVADIFGLEQLETLLNFFDRLLDEPLPAAVLTTIDGAITTFDSALTDVKAKAAGEVEELRTVVLAAAEQLRALKELLRPAMDVLVKIASAPILQPGELEKRLEAEIDRALGVKVHDVAKVDDPYKALLDRIDAAIAGIDLASVRTSVLDALHTLRDTIAKADLGAAGEALQDALQPIQDTVDDLQAGATELLNDLKGALEQASGQVRTQAESVGAFAPDGTYTFALAGELHDALSTVRDVVSGDIAGGLDEFKHSIDDFLSQLTNLLEPVEQAVTGAANGAKQAITDFAGFVEELDVPKLLDDLAKKVDEVVHALTPIDFQTLADPVIAELNENAEKIKGIDASKLNDLLKQALSAALDLIIHIDISLTIEPELRKKLDEVKQVPDAVVGELQERYEQALHVLDQLRPSQLLEALFAAFDTIDKAISGLDAAQLLGPLDALHQRTLRQPVADLKPATLLQPLEDAFGDLEEAVAQLEGAELLAPVQQGLDTLKAKVAALDLTGPVDDLRAALADLTGKLESMKPSGLIEPLADDLAKLETELDRFKPSVVFGPVAQLATPLLELLEDIEQEAVTALHDAVQAPLAVFERLKPEKLQAELQAKLDAIIAAIEGLHLPARYEALRARHAEFRVTAAAAGGALRADLVLLIDVELELKGFVTAHDLLLQALRNLKRELKLEGLKEAYDQLEQRLLDLLPPWGRALLDPAAFKLVMQMANPLRFLDELDARFETIKQKLIPITPQEIASELDAAHAEVLEQVHNIGLDERLVQVKAMIEELRGIVTGLRIDFVADEVDRALDDVRAVVAALDPAQLAPDLDGLHADVLEVVDAAKPSLVLANLNAPLSALKDIVGAIDPREQLGKPLDEAWKAIDTQLGEVDVAAVVAPVDARLDELEQDFEAQLKRVEKALDDMLRAARGVLSSSGAGASAGAGF